MRPSIDKPLTPEEVKKMEERGVKVSPEDTLAGRIKLTRAIEETHRTHGAISAKGRTELLRLLFEPSDLKGDGSSFRITQSPKVT